MPRRHYVREALGLGRQTIKGVGYEPVTSTEARGPTTGVLRLYWRIRDPGTPRVSGAIPRVKIGWSVFIANSGELQNFSIVADAWYGRLVIEATSASISAGYVKGETVGPDALIEATIFDGDGGGGSGQFAAYTKPVALPGAAGPAPPAPVVVDVPSQVVAMRWFDKAGSQIEIIGKDGAGEGLQRCQVPAAVAGALYTPPLFPVEPEVAGGTAEVTNLSAVAVAQGRLVFYYVNEGQQ